MERCGYGHGLRQARRVGRPHLSCRNVHAIVGWEHEYEVPAVRQKAEPGNECGRWIRRPAKRVAREHGQERPLSDVFLRMAPA